MQIIDEDGTALYLAAAEVYNLVSDLYGLGVEIPPSIPIWLHYTWGGAGTQIEAARKALAGISGPTAVIAGLANFLHNLRRQLALGVTGAALARIGYDVGIMRMQYLDALQAIDIDSVRIVLRTNTMLHDIVNSYNSIGG